MYRWNLLFLKTSEALLSAFLIMIGKAQVVEIFISSTRILPLPLPIAQLRWQERVGGVFLCGD